METRLAKFVWKIEAANRWVIHQLYGRIPRFASFLTRPLWRLSFWLLARYPIETTGWARRQAQQYLAGNRAPALGSRTIEEDPEAHKRAVQLFESIAHAIRTQLPPAQDEP